MGIERVEFTVTGRDRAEIREAVRQQLDRLGDGDDGVPWVHMELDIRPLEHGEDGMVSVWQGEFLAQTGESPPPQTGESAPP